MEPEIRFCTTSDGVRIGYRMTGQGPPLVFVRGWISSLQFIGREPVSWSFFQSLADVRLVVQYDARGNGLSDRHVPDVSLDALVLDLEALVDHLALDTSDLYGQAYGGPIAISYAAKHQHRVSRLILDGTFARGRSIMTPEQLEALVGGIRAHWDATGAALDYMTTPEPRKEELSWTAHQAAISPQMAADLFELAYRIDVTDQLSQIRTPTLVVHRRDNKAIPFEAGLKMASQMPNARFVPLEGTAQNPWQGNMASVLSAVGDFLGVEIAPVAVTPSPPTAGLQGVVTILFTDIGGSTALTQRLGDAKAQELLSTHNAIVRDGLARCGGIEIKHTGDGIMASFSSASRAIECAVAIQRGVAAYVEQHTDIPLQVRIGLNSGEPVAEEKDLFGTAVQLARRICDEGKGGEILVSDVVRQLVAGKGFLFAARDEVVLKGFEDPVLLHEVRWQA